MEKLIWKTEQRLVRELIPTDYNPRIRNEKKQAKLQHSLAKFNLVETPVINRDNHIIAGQRRWEAYYESGKENESIDVRLPNRMLTEEEVKEYILISNTHAGEWDLPKLETHFADIYKEIVELPDLSATLHSADMLDKKKAEQKEVIEDEFCDAPPAEPTTQAGDLYELNSHRFLCADSTDQYALAKLMNKQLAQMVFTDPPYNVRVKDIVGNGKKKHEEFQMASGEMNKSRFTRFLEDVFLNLIKFSKDGSIHFVCMDWKHVNELTTAGKIYTELKNMIVWKKNNGGMGSFYRSQHELIFAYKNGKKKHINNFGLGDSGRYRTNVWEYTGVNSWGAERENLEDHPTVKPVKLVADALLDCSEPYGTVLDVFLGSGTTLIAAEQTNRICYGVELDAKYCDLIVRRYLRFMKSKNQEVTIKRNGIILSESELKNYEK
ncbi:MAG: DNA modification methylase [Prevotellaceae bacterium]|jgi:DNA modification methylase|nr:DNA modification methylase [Prevotellaceae bacterium]